MDGRKVDRDMAAHFGRNLFRSRRWAGYSQEEVARQTGLHRTAIGMLEAGTRLPRLDTVMKIAGALGGQARGSAGGNRVAAARPLAGGQFRPPP